MTETEGMAVFMANYVPCLMADAVVQVRRWHGAGEEAATQYVRVSALRAGDDHVLTGTHGEFRRVTRVWRTPVGRDVAVHEPVAGCRVTGLHPLLAPSGQWVYAARAAEVEAHAPPRIEFCAAVYNLELEGHTDTVRLGCGPGPRSVVAACIGKYCGEECDGWSVWTRKTTRCDAAACAACDVCVHPELDFAHREGRPRLAVRFEPYC